MLQMQMQMQMPDKTVMMEALEVYVKAGNAVFTAAHAVADRVLCKWKTGEWYPATIRSVDGWSGLCDVDWDDGDTRYRFGKKANELAPLPSPPPSSAFTPAAAAAAAAAHPIDLGTAEAACPSTAEAACPSTAEASTEACPGTAEASTEACPSTAEASTEACPGTAEASTNTESEVALPAPEPEVAPPAPEPVLPSPEPAEVRAICVCPHCLSFPSLEC